MWRRGGQVEERVRISTGKGMRMDEKLNLPDEEVIAELQEFLTPQYPLPPGVALHMDVALAREARRLSAMSSGEVATLTLLVFFLGSMGLSSFLNFFLLALALAGSIAYGIGFRWVSRLEE